MIRVRALSAIVVTCLIVTACGTGQTSSPTTLPSSRSVPPSSSASAAPESAAPSDSKTPGPAALKLFGALPSVALEDPTAKSLQAIIERTVQSGAPDILAAVITDAGTWAGAAGIDGPDKRKASPTDEFAIASVTKLFTATLVMRLVEQGKIDLDAPIASYLGSVTFDTGGATVRQALGMLSGLPADFGDDVVADIVADPAHHWTIAELTGRTPTVTVEPGSSFIYSNAGYALIAEAAGNAAGTDYASALRSEVLDPVGAVTILEQGAGAPTPKPWALPIEPNLGRYKPADLGAGDAIPSVSSATFSTGGASMASDAPALAAWVWQLFAGGIIKGDSLAVMLPATGHDYGLGMETLAGLGEQPVYGHTGSKTGYGSIAAVFPERHVVVVVFVNDPEFVIEPVVREIRDAAAPR